MNWRVNGITYEKCQFLFYLYHLTEYFETEKTHPRLSWVGKAVK